MTLGALFRPHAVLGLRARLRWVHLLIGGALLMPYFLLANVLLPLVTGNASTPFVSPATQFLTLAVALPLAALSALLFPLMRPLETAMAQALCGPGDAELATGPARTWAERARPALYFTLHVGAGGIVSGMSLTAPPAAAGLMALPFLDRNAPGRLPWFRAFDGPWLPVATPLAGLALLALPVVTSWAAGAALARCAPVLLGPSPADRLRAAEERARRLAVRNRLARELHDSVGHALSAVLLQAGAARKVLDADPGFAREALAAIEETTRTAVGELDTVLGLLREGRPGLRRARPHPRPARRPAGPHPRGGRRRHPDRAAGPHRDPARRLPRGVPDRAGRSHQRPAPRRARPRRAAHHRRRHDPGGHRGEPRRHGQRPPAAARPGRAAAAG
ncbi:hypothetical protein GCM10020221_14070 [Streptomyces thioluteus]|uniref:histidine kinase n=1 Tax=Streptomyces thioluteus TaxID=66431 RepID=A0ABN3WME7_STRTU